MKRTIRRTLRHAATATAAVVALLADTLAAIPAAEAAAPANDTQAGAIPLTLGQTYTQDTTGATLDAELAASMGWGENWAVYFSVWYSFTATTDGNYLIDTSASDYFPWVSVYEDTISPDTVVGNELIRAKAGHTYWVMISDSPAEYGGTGGSLSLHFYEPPAAYGEVKTDTTVTLHPDGTATAPVRVMCTGGSWIEGWPILTQRTKAGTVNAYGSDIWPATCDGAWHRVQMMLSSDVDTPPLRPGKATLDMIFGVTSYFGYTHDNGPTTVALVPGR